MEESSEAANYATSSYAHLYIAKKKTISQSLNNL